MKTRSIHAPIIALAALLGVGCKPKADPPPAPKPTPPPVAPKPQPKPQPKPEPKPEKPPFTHFQLPTTNTGLLENKNDSFFMYVKRATVSGEVKVWQGGQYGFVRDPKMAKDGSIIYTRFHEGMDVAPMIRDLKGEPQDEVRAIADGTVLYTNTNPGKSNYGNYIIIEHPTEDGPFYSLSAHFHEVKVSRGKKLRAGDIIGIMGHTGSGIDRERSHTHVELTMLLKPSAAIWNQQEPVAPTPPPTASGKPAKPPAAPRLVLNGQNLVGLNVSGWLKAHAAKPELRLAEFINQEPPYFKVRVPCRGTELEIVKRYPWLRVPGSISQAWEISVAASSVPLSIAPLDEKVDFPTVSWVKPWTGDHSWKSREMLTGTGSIASLSKHGMEYLKLLLGD